MTLGMIVYVIWVLLHCLTYVILCKALYKHLGEEGMGFLWGFSIFFLGFLFVEIFLGLQMLVGAVALDVGLFQPRGSDSLLVPMSIILIPTFIFLAILLLCCLCCCVPYVLLRMLRFVTTGHEFECMLDFTVKGVACSICVVLCSIVFIPFALVMGVPFILKAWLIIPASFPWIVVLIPVFIFCALCLVIPMCILCVLPYLCGYFVFWEPVWKREWLLSDLLYDWDALSARMDCLHPPLIVGCYKKCFKRNG